MFCTKQYGHPAVREDCPTSKHYRTEDIEIAKKKFYKVCPTDTRMLNRKGPNKNVQNLADVVKRLNELDPESEVIPCFVARDLGHLPLSHSTR